MVRRFLGWSKKTWDSWHHLDAALSLLERIRTWGGWAIAAITYGGAVISIVLAVVFVAVGWLVNWGPYIVAPVAIIVATVPNYLMWHSRQRVVTIAQAVSPSERLFLAEPLDDAIVGSPFEVRGYANAMEGNIIVETKNEQGEWYVIANPMAALGPEGHLYRFSTYISLKPGKYPLRVCAEPFMSDERQYNDCAEIEITVNKDAGSSSSR